jgi:hypothetical protein
MKNAKNLNRKIQLRNGVADLVYSITLVLISLALAKFRKLAYK